ncbi:MAG: wall-associated protein, partial [Clostridia bacterium]
GNPTQYKDKYYMEWSGRELKGVMSKLTSSLVALYSYDDAGLRTSKAFTGKFKTTYTNGRLTTQRSPSGQLCFSYDASGNLVAVYHGATMYYYMRNAQNDITGLVDSNGNVVVRYTYDSWGNPLGIHGANGADLSGDPNHIANVNPFRYRGYYYDAETGFYYLKSR